MKPIKLTIKQQKKLLEMANKLFPEKGKFFEVLCGDIYYSKNGKFPGFSIHWFEFCLFHLRPRIIEKYPFNNTYNGLYINNVFYSGNIVNYLYKKFKKTK
jgi:hypothetical protein